MADISRVIEERRRHRAAQMEMASHVWKSLTFGERLPILRAARQLLSKETKRSYEEYGVLNGYGLDIFEMLPLPFQEILADYVEMDLGLTFHVFLYRYQKPKLVAHNP